MTAVRTLGAFRRLAFPLLALAIAHAGGADAHTQKHKGLEIVHPWCFAGGDAAAKTAAIYMVVRNTTKRADRLIGATAADGQKIELREPSDTGPGAESRVVSGLAIGAGKETVLRNGGPHLLLTGIERPYEAYDAFLVTLVFERAGELEIEVAVEEAPAPRHQ